MLSNHDMEFIRDYENAGLVFTGRSGLSDNQSKSLKSMVGLIRRSLITEAEVRELVGSVYVPMVKAIGYTVSSDKREISLFTHAPVGLETIEKLAEVFGVTYREDTIDDLIETINAINIGINRQLSKKELARIVDSEFSKIKTEVGQEDYFEGDISPNLPLSRLIWSRVTDGIRTTKKATSEKLPYEICFSHGHVGQDERQMHPRHTNLDSEFGKHSNFRTDNMTYHRIRHSPQMTAHQLTRRAIPVVAKPMDTKLPIAPRATKSPFDGIRRMAAEAKAQKAIVAEKVDKKPIIASSAAAPLAAPSAAAPVAPAKSSIFASSLEAAARFKAKKERMQLDIEAENKEPDVKKPK